MQPPIGGYSGRFQSPAMYYKQGCGAGHGPSALSFICVTQITSGSGIVVKGI